ncbi:uncharacterized protein TNCV_2714021 [Trichonephila clavipes]|nr:uncharacterized protein TNCV_2714021 [Trichonephila clavipes]
MTIYRYSLVGFLGGPTTINFSYDYLVTSPPRVDIPLIISAYNKEKWLNGIKTSYHSFLYVPRDRQSNTCLSQLASGHLKSLTFSGGNKRFATCPQYQLEQASPQHILDYIGLDWEDIHGNLLLVSDFIKDEGFTDWALDWMGGKYSPAPTPMVSAVTAHKTFEPTDLTSTYSVCTRRVFGGIELSLSGLESNALTTRLPTTYYAAHLEEK